MKIYVVIAYDAYQSSVCAAFASYTKALEFMQEEKGQYPELGYELNTCDYTGEID